MFKPAVLILLLAPGAALAELPPGLSVGEAQDGTALEDVPPERLDLLPAMDVRRWPDDGFFETHISLLDALSSAHSEERGAVMLDLAELYLGQMLTIEAADFVAAAEQTAWVESPRYTALNDAVRLLRGMPVVDADTSPLLSEGRQDRALWASLHGIASGDARMLAENLRTALVGLAFQSGPVARALLPLITEAAVSLQDIDTSVTALSLMTTVPDLAEAPMGQYLRGRHEANIGNEKSALDAYFAASQGWDNYAARARIALADLAIADGSPGALLAARDVLSVGAGAWRGDAFETAVLERQAEVNGLLGDSVAALLAYRRIITRFPESVEAQDAMANAGSHLDQVYRDGAEGRTDLADWFDLHQFLLPTYRYLPQFPIFNERLADAVFDLGSTYLAISEYRQTLTIYEEWPQVLGREADVQETSRVHYKLGKALLRAGLWAEALETLDQIPVSDDEAFRDAINRLRVVALSELGDGDTVLRTYVSNPDADSLRSWGRALFVKEDWAAARDQYARMFDSYRDQFRLGDASYLLIAAHRSGDVELARRVASAFPELTASDGISGLAMSLLNDAAPLAPLGKDMTSDMLNSAQSTVSLIEDSGF